MNYRFLLSSTVLTFSLVTNAAKSEYKQIEDCGSASVVSGVTCSDVKVQLKFDKCKLKSDSKIASKIICEKTLIKARFEEGGYRYQAEFDKVDDGWGAITWKQLGGVNQWEKIVPESASEEKPVTEKPATAKKSSTKKQVVTPVLEPAVIPAPAATTQNTSAASPFKFGGFFDFRYSNLSVTNDPLIAKPLAESGYGLEDGAFYANYEKNKVAMVADVSFRRTKDSDFNSTAAVPNQSQNNNFIIAVDKSQLYLRYKLGADFTMDFGQFDTIYGVELNDSKDRTFGKTGMVYDLMLPVTHAGVMFEFSKNGYLVKTFAANPNNKGTNGSSAAGDDRSEYGAAAGFSNENIRYQAGYMSRYINRASSGIDFGSRSLIDVTAGVTIKSFTIDFEYANIIDSSKNSLTAANSTDLEAPGMGVLALTTFKFSDLFWVGARYEHIENDPGNAGQNILMANSYGINLHYKLSEEVEVRTEYIGYDYKAIAGNTWKDARFNVAGLIVF